MRIIVKNGIKAAVIEKTETIGNAQDILDIIASAYYMYDCDGLIVYEECLGSRFFDLKTGYAGEVLQKFSNYGMKLAIIGRFNRYPGKSLHDFIYECNQGNLVFFKETEEAGLDAFRIRNSH